MSKAQLIECLRVLAKKNGFTLPEFVKYKASIMEGKCFDGYKVVYPENPKMSTVPGKQYVDNLDIMLSDNLYSGTRMIKLSDCDSSIL